jgi:hypothetical protein
MLNVIMLSIAFNSLLCWMIAECCVLFLVMPSVVMLSVVMLSIVKLSVVMLSVVMLSVVILGVVMLSVVMPKLLELDTEKPVFEIAMFG